MGFKMKGWKAFTTKDHSNNKPDGRAGSSAFQKYKDSPMKQREKMAGVEKGFMEGFSEYATDKMAGQIPNLKKDKKSKLAKTFEKGKEKRKIKKDKYDSAWTDARRISKGLPEVNATDKKKSPMKQGFIWDKDEEKAMKKLPKMGDSDKKSKRKTKKWERHVERKMGKKGAAKGTGGNIGWE